MSAEADSAQESIVLASFESRRHAEHMLSSLGREFRRRARKRQVAGFVVSEHKDGSLRLTEAHVLTASGIEATLIHLSLSWTVGFLGLFSSLRGAMGIGHAVHVHEGHVGSDEHAAHAMLDRAGGTHAALALVCCQDEDTRRAVAARAAELGSESWEGSRSEFLDALDPGSSHDWVRSALGAPSPGGANGGRRGGV